MPSPLAHTVAGYAVLRALERYYCRDSNSCDSRPPLGTIAVLSLLPDLDFIAGIIFGNVGKKHNNISHSFVFGILVGLAIGSIRFIAKGGGFVGWFLLTSTCYTVHLALDFWSTKRGLMLLWPFSSRRLVAPVKLFYGFRWKTPPWSKHHLQMIVTESLFALMVYTMLKLILGRRGS